MVVWFLIAFSLIFIVGHTVLRWIDREGVYGSFIEQCALSYMIGLGAITFVQVGALAARLPLTRGSILLLLSPFVLAWFVRVKGARSPVELKSYWMSMPGELYARGRRAFGELNRIERGAVIGLVVLCLYVVYVGVLLPLNNWDAMSTWAFKAKVIFTNKTIFTEDFLDPTRFSLFPAYPLLVPLSESYIWNMLGQPNEHVMKVFFALIYASVVAQVYWQLKRYFSVPRALALIGTLACCSIPSVLTGVDGSAVSGYADFPVGAFFAMSLFYLFNYMRSGVKTHLLTGSLLGACALSTKNEAVPLTLLALVIISVEVLSRQRPAPMRGWKIFAWYLGIMFLLMLPWLSVRPLMPTQASDNNPLPYFFGSRAYLKELYRFEIVFRLSLREMFFNLKSWGLLWYLAAIAIFLPRKYDLAPVERRIEWYLALFPWVYYLFVINPIYVFWASTQGHPTEAEFDGMSFERFRFHCIIILWMFIIVRLGRYLSSRGFTWSGAGKPQDAPNIRG